MESIDFGIEKNIRRKVKMVWGQSKTLNEDEIAIGCKPATFYAFSIVCKLKQFGQMKVIIKDREYLTSKNMKWSIVKQWDIVYKLLNEGASVKIIDDKYQNDGTRILLLEW
jgi:DNA-binding protein